MIDIALAHFRGQGDQGSPVVHQANVFEVVRHQLEIIPTPDLQVVMAEGGKGFTRVNAGFLLRFLEKILAGNLT